MMPKRGRVVAHKMIIFNDSEDISVCGLWIVANPVTRWSETTCKRCLSRRKKERVK